MITNQIVPKVQNPELFQKPEQEDAADVANIEELLASFSQELEGQQDVSAETNASVSLNPEKKTLEGEEDVMPEEAVELPEVSANANLLDPGPVDVKASKQEGMVLPEGKIDSKKIIQPDDVAKIKTQVNAAGPNKVSNELKTAGKVSDQPEGQRELGKILHALNGEVKSIKSEESNKVHAEPSVKRMSGTEFLNTKFEVQSDLDNADQKVDRVSLESKETLDKLDHLLPKEGGQAKNLDGLAIRTLEATPSHNFSSSNSLPKVEIDGHVTQGAMATNRFSTEALTGITSQIKTFARQGGGEMTIRLKPENLGELQVRVNTIGDNVGLQIKASDSDAKTILQDSLKYLQESLSKHNMSLGRVHISVAGESSAANSHMNDFSGFDQKGQSDLTNFFQGGSQGDYGRSEFGNQWTDQSSSYDAGKGLSKASQALRSFTPSHSYGKVGNSSHNLDLRA